MLHLSLCSSSALHFISDWGPEWNYVHKNISHNSVRFLIFQFLSQERLSRKRKIANNAHKFPLPAVVPRYAMNP